MNGRISKRKLFWFTRAIALSLLAALVLVLSLARSTRADEPKLLAPRDMPDVSMPAEAIVIPSPPSTFKSRDEGWIRFSYPSSQEGRISYLLEAANDVRAELAAELGRPVLDQVDVRIARTFEEMAALAPVGMPPPDYAEGVTYARLRLVIISLVAPNSSEPPNLTEVLKHELAHQALHDAVGGHAVPRWFNEGYAVHASGESSLVRTKTLWTATLAKRLLPMSDLDRSFPAHSDLASIAYAQSADFVRYLLRRQDRARFNMFIERLERGEPFDRAITDAYSSDLRRLEFQWREELNKRFSWAPVILGGGLLWIGAIVLVGLAFLKRRRDTRKTLARWAREEAEEDRRAKEARERPPVHVIISHRDQALSFPAPPVRAANGEPVPKVEHDGRWHTVH
ncbi:MAG: hypothetical protein HY898_30905 [Deltaproteobacteria bacterium]|nr:hypothetical protein [Deltaproteobacteria bacterium]